jgi:sirohydrochlorin cobaltochelatase
MSSHTAAAAVAGSAAAGSADTKMAGERQSASAVVLFAHGARDSQWAAPFQAIQRLVSDRLPGVPIELSYLELMSPDLSSTIARLAARGTKHITVAPLFMAQGGHLKHDLPALIEEVRARYPGITVRLTPAIGESPEILHQIASWVAARHVSA